MRKPWDTKNDNLEFVEGSPMKEKTSQTRMQLRLFFCRD